MMQIIQRGKEEGHISNNLSPEAILLYIKMFRDVLNYPGLMLEENRQMQLDLSNLFFYGLVGRK